MKRCIVHLQNRFFNTPDDRGAAMAEYGLLLSFVALVVVSVLVVFGETLGSPFGLATDTLDANNPSVTTTATP